MKANAAQERVINEIDGQMIVIACPGSGKTTTLLRRINHMIQDEGINPEEILMITFTKAAADEMKERFQEKYDKNAPVTFCTIHSLCMAVLKKFAGFNLECIMANSYPVIMKIIKDDVRHMKIDDLDAFTKDVLSDISMVKNNMEDLNEYQPKCCSDKAFFLDIFNAYEKEKESRGVIDYDDMLVKAYNLMMSERDCLDYLRDKYGYIHVDEYQDTNFVQRDIVYAIAGVNGNVVVVGDDDQSIYAFRGAKPEVMQDFQKHYKNAKAVYMSTNYRSDKKIIQAASHLVSNNHIRFDKDIVSSSSEDGNVSIKRMSGKNESYVQMCIQINQMVSNGVNPNDIAVLYRINSQSGDIAGLLMQYKIPFYSNEPIHNRYEDEMFKDIIAYYKMSQGTGNQSDFIRTITKPNRFFVNGSKMSHSDSKEKMQQISMKASCESWKIKNSVENIDKYHKLLFCLKFMNPAQFLPMMFTQGKYCEYLKFYADYRNISFDDLKTKWESYENDIKRNDIKTFDEWIKYAERFTAMIRNKQNSKEGVCLSTMHKSKGLEWDNVFIVDCMEGSIPYYKAESVSEMEEERRLFYVAMTRAKHNLNLYCYKSGTNSKNSSSLKKESRFLAECQIS